MVTARLLISLGREARGGITLWTERFDPSTHPLFAMWLVRSVVDTAVVGSSSAAELAALGPATMLTDSTAYLFFWLNVANTSQLAQLCL